MAREGGRLVIEQYFLSNPKQGGLLLCSLPGELIYSDFHRFFLPYFLALSSPHPRPPPPSPSGPLCFLTGIFCGSILFSERGSPLSLILQSTDFLVLSRCPPQVSFGLKAETDGLFLACVSLWWTEPGSCGRQSKSPHWELWVRSDFMNFPFPSASESGNSNRKDVGGDW